MKKLALILALIIIPCSAFGLEMLNDNAMDQVTGQAGVSIALDDVQMFINIEKFAYIDCDGFNSVTSGYGTCSGSPGAIAINNFQIDVLNMNAIVSSVDADDTGVQTTGNAGSMPLYSTACGLIPLFYDYGTSAAPGCYLGSVAATAETLGLNNYLTSSALGSLEYFQARALTIDVSDDLPSLTAGWQQNWGTAASSSFTVGGVLIGIPTLEIYINSLSMTPVYDGDISGAASTAVNDDNRGATYGTIVLEGVTFTTLSGWLEIAPH